MSGTIDFAEFLQVIDYQKSNADKDDGSNEIVHAFTACGGNPDKSGFVRHDRVIHVVKEIFKLHFDIEKLLTEMDKFEETKQLTFEQFNEIFN
jgi:calmodulin